MTAESSVNDPCEKSLAGAIEHINRAMQVIRAAIADTAAEDSMGNHILNKEDCLMIRKILRSTLPLLAIAVTGLLFMTACQDNSTSAPGAETVNSRRAKDSA